MDPVRFGSHSVPSDLQAHWQKVGTSSGILTWQTETYGLLVKGHQMIQSEFRTQAKMKSTAETRHQHSYMRLRA